MNNNGLASNAYDSRIRSDVEAKLRHFLVELGNADKLLGIQVCVYKDGEIIIDTAAGVLGKDPVQPDSLFPCLSLTKGVTAGMWRIKGNSSSTKISQTFGLNLVNHTAGLHNALAGISEEDDPKLFCDFEQCLKHIVEAAPETQPGQVELYHYLSYGWLCGGIIQKASGKKFQEILEEAFVRPLNVEGEFYIGIPPIVESRLATLAIDTNVISWHAEQVKTITYLPSTYTFNMISTIVAISNTLNVRCAIVPAANGHFSARALARYYATLVNGGIVPARHSSSLDSQLNNPTFPSNKTDTKIFNNSKENIHNAFLGHGAYKYLSFPNGKFGLGFQKFKTADGSVIGFGHPGLGGSTGYCDINNRFAIGVTFNKLHSGGVTEEIVRFVCSNLDIPVPQDQHERSTGFTHKSVIN